MYMLSLVFSPFFFSICVGFILYMTLKSVLRRRRQISLRKIYFWGIVALLLPIGYILSILSFFYFLSYTPTHEFSEKAWENEPDKRVEIIDDMMERRLLDGLTREDVVALLGKPDDNTSQFRSLNWDMIYHLGPESGVFRIDSEWLLIWLKNDTVAKYEVRKTEW